MVKEIEDHVKQEIFNLVCKPQIQIEDIPKIINGKYNTDYDYETVLKILTDEYLKHDLNYGRRLCCRF